MKSNKKDNNVKWGITIKENKNIPSMESDPFFVKQLQEAIKDMERNPPPEWILKRMRGED